MYSYIYIYIYRERVIGALLRPSNAKRLYIRTRN